MGNIYADFKAQTGFSEPSLVEISHIIKSSKCIPSRLARQETSLDLNKLIISHVALKLCQNYSKMISNWSS